MNDWLEVTVETTDAGMEDLAARLTMNGAEGLVLENEGDFKTFLEQNRQYWDYVDDALLERMKGVARIKFYVTDDPEGRARMKAALKGIDNPVSTVPMKEEDWAYGWQKYYQPMSVGEKLYIVPEWERDKPVPEGRTAVYLNPGLTFGTGSHASTQLCLELLEGQVQRGDKVLDLGCGSGILSIAALRLGADSAVGVDIDPKAVDVAYENAALNHIGRGWTLSPPPKTEEERLRHFYKVRAGDVLSDQVLVEELVRDGPYGVVLANIVADVIIPLSAQVGRFIRQDGNDPGVFICSGIIDTRRDEVQAALEKNGLHVIERLERDGWCAMAAILK